MLEQVKGKPGNVDSYSTYFPINSSIGEVPKKESRRQYRTGKLGKEILLMMALDWDGSWI